MHLIRLITHSAALLQLVCEELFIENKAICKGAQKAPVNLRSFPKTTESQWGQRCLVIRGLSHSHSRTHCTGDGEAELTLHPQKAAAGLTGASQGCRLSMLRMRQRSPLLPSPSTFFSSSPWNLGCPSNLLPGAALACQLATWSSGPPVP